MCMYMYSDYSPFFFFIQTFAFDHCFWSMDSKNPKFDGTFKLHVHVHEHVRVHEHVHVCTCTSISNSTVLEY